MLCAVACAREKGACAGDPAGDWRLPEGAVRKGSIRPVSGAAFALAGGVCYDEKKILKEGWRVEWNFAI